MDKSDRRLRIFTDGKATFGYQLNVGNMVLGALYEYYISLLYTTDAADE